MTAFKIGSVYRDRDGDLIRLTHAVDGHALAEYFNVHERLWLEYGACFTATGECLWLPDYAPTGDIYNLLPGELEQNEQGDWVPVARGVEDGVITRIGGCTFHFSAGIHQTPVTLPDASGVEEKEEQVDDLVWLLGPLEDEEEDSEERDNMPMVSRDSIGVPALTWNTETKFDPFKGFVLESKHSPDQPKQAPVPAQRMSEVERIGGWVLVRR